MQRQKEPGSIMCNIREVTCGASLDVATFDQPTHCLFMCLGLHKVIDHHQVLKKQVAERAFVSVSST